MNSSSRISSVVAAAVCALAGLFLSSCQSSNTGSVASAPAADSRYVGSAESGGMRPAAAPAPAKSRPGLGTKGSDHDSWNTVTGCQFYRKSSVPDAVASFHYNDEDGAKAMADLLGGGVRRTGLMETAGGRLRAGLVSYGSEAFPYLDAKTRQIVMGTPGSAYEIRLENRTKHRLEVVVSVDSLNVITGGAASMEQRGYVLDPKGTVNIAGFRVNDNYVRRFEFSSVAASKAAGQGLARNVGVVGLAVFEEDEAKAKMLLRKEQFQRDDANAFPLMGR